MRIFIFLWGLLTLQACSESGQLAVLSGKTMGTTYTIKIHSKTSLADPGKFSTEIESKLTRINQIMSTYIDDSELSVLNQYQGNECLAVSDDLFEVLSESIRVNIISEGAFDVTVGPLVNLWGFGPDGQQQLPSDQEIKMALETSGIDRIHLDKQQQCVSKQAGVYIDLSAIAKGYAVDVIADYLDSQSIDNYMIEIGGEVYASGTNSKGATWKIGIEQPNPEIPPSMQNVHRVIELDHKGMATSGNYRNFFEIDGKRYSHTVDPRTGRPVQHNIVSVTVLHKTTMTADALATAMMVTDLEKGLEIANNQDIAVLFIVAEDNAFSNVASNEFSRLLH